MNYNTEKREKTAETLWILMPATSFAELAPDPETTSFIELARRKLTQNAYSLVRNQRSTKKKIEM